MATRIGLNLTSLEDVQVPDFNISTNGKEIMAQIPQKANLITNGWLGYGILGSMFFALFWVLSDKTPSGDFGYDGLQAAGISFGIISIFGMLLLNLEFIYNLIVVSSSIFMTMIFTLIIYWTES